MLETRSKSVLQRIATPFFLVLAYFIFLLLLSAAELVLTSRRVAEQVRTTEISYRLKDDALETIRLDIYKIAVAARDVLLDPRPRDAVEVIVGSEKEIAAQLGFLRRDADADNQRLLRQIEEDLRIYLQAVYSMIDEAKAHGWKRPLPQALPARESILVILKQLSNWNDKNFEAAQLAIGNSIYSLRREFLTSLSMILFLGTLAGCAGFVRIRGIQRKNEDSHQRIAEASLKLKSLSNQLVTAQEVERKALSRELHDEIGQSLTALKLELARGEKIARAEGSGVVDHLEAIRSIADQTLRATKSISLGLRPPMLDDLGLLEALNWFTNDYSRRTGIVVELAADGELSRLSEAHRTCVYRVVQEALTNCARHAGARLVQIRVDSNGEQLTLSLSDDGVGFDPKARIGTGLGLISMQERAAELGGRLEIQSVAGQGTSLQLMFPVGQDSGVPLAD